MSYIVIKTIGGRQYRYQQTSYRVGKKVKTKSVYLGPVAGNGSAFVSYSPRFDEEKALRDIKAADAKYAAMIERFTKEVGLKIGPDNPVPIDKEAARPRAPAPAPAATPAPSATPSALNDAPAGAAANEATSEGKGEAS